MDESPGRTRPRTFFLNEQHELAHGEKPSGGSIAKYMGINWADKAQKLSKSLGTVKKELVKSNDPVRDQHYFMLAKPLQVLIKPSKNKKIASPEGTVEKKPDFAQDDSTVFRKLGLDLLRVNSDGSATVHAKPGSFEQLSATSQLLDKVNEREKVRWATIDSFATIPASFRIDQTWFKSLKSTDIADAVVELQPLLGRRDIDAIIRALGEMLKRQAGEAVRAMGKDFSGRQWLRAKIARASLLAIAENFFSVQSLHSPLLSATAHASNPSSRDKARSTRPVEPQPNIETMPSVAVLDTGVPSDHAILRPFRRGQYVGPTSAGAPIGDHGSMVASRIVFGNADANSLQNGTAKPSCRYYDAIVATSAVSIEDKAILPALEAIAATAPDVRVFNLSFDCLETWDTMDPVKKSEYLSLVQDLDNFIFANDIIAVVAAGNSPQNTAPATAYPGHHGDPNWALGPWARSFNSMTCGALVDRLTSGGLAENVGWPSPITKVGLGLCGSPKPDYSAPGGNVNTTYTSYVGHGVWGYNAQGLAEDRSGTSFAAPILAREAAIAFQKLQQVCQSGARPFACTIKSFLALTAEPHSVSGAAKDLADLTLGMGLASSDRISNPLAGSAVLVWQGVLKGPKDIARVQLPIPLAWFKAAEKPTLRLVVAWDSPANSAVTGIWACRKIIARLRTSPDVDAAYGSKNRHASYPLSDRQYDLKKVSEKTSVESDLWLLEFFYEQTADYYAAIDFDPQQRISFSAELYDAGPKRVSPQMALQSLEIASMQRLSVPPAAVGSPVLIKTRA